MSYIPSASDREWPAPYHSATDEITFSPAVNSGTRRSRTKPNRPIEDRLLAALAWLARAFLEGSAAYALSLYSPLANTEDGRELQPDGRRIRPQELNPGGSARCAGAHVEFSVRSAGLEQAAGIASEGEWSWWLERDGRLSIRIVNGPVILGGARRDRIPPDRADRVVTRERP